MRKLNSSLDQLRQEIDALDNDLLLILSKRMKVAVAIGKYKNKHGLKPLDKKRWQIVLKSRIAQGVCLGLPLTLIRNLFELIHKHSLSVQKRIKS